MSLTTSKKNIGKSSKKTPIYSSGSDSSSESEGNGITDQKNPNFQWGVKGKDWKYEDESESESDESEGDESEE